jgi:hypothetical protein
MNAFRDTVIVKHISMLREKSAKFLNDGKYNEHITSNGECATFTPSVM